MAMRCRDSDRNAHLADLDAAQAVRDSDLAEVVALLCLVGDLGGASDDVSAAWAQAFEPVFEVEPLSALQARFGTKACAMQLAPKMTLHAN